MTNQFDFENDPEFKKMSEKEKLDFLKAHASGRDPKTGRYLKDHSGNYGGRPKARTTLNACLNKSFSKKVKVKIDGKMVTTTNLQLTCDMMVQKALAEGDVKTLMRLLKHFGPAVDLSEEFPSPKIRPLKEDPSVEMIKNAIFKRFDEEFGVNTDDDNDLIE